MYKQLKHVASWLSRRAVLLFVLFLAALLLGTSLYHFNKQNVVLETQFASHMQLVDEKATYEHLNLTISTAESAIRAYAITGDKRFTQNYLPAIEAIPSIYNRFKTLHSSNQALPFVKYDDWIVKKVVLMMHIKLLCDANKNGEAKQLIASNEALRVADTIAEANNVVLQKAIDASKKQFLATNDFHNTLAYTSIGTAIALLFGLFYFLVNEVLSRKKLNDELRQQKEYFRITINSIAEGLITTDNMGAILYMNAAAEKLTGWSKEDAKGLPLERIYDIVNESTGLHFENVVSRILKSGQTIDFENNTILYTKSNQPLIISNSGSPIFDSKGNVSGAVLVFNNISERKKVEKALTESEMFSRGVIDSLSSSLAIINAQGIVLKVNKAWSDFALQNDADATLVNGVGTNYFDVCMCDSNTGNTMAAQTLAGIKNVLNGSLEAFYLEYPCHSANAQRWFYMRVMKFESAETMAVIEHHDITERKLAEEKTLKAIERYEILAKATSDTIWDWDIANDKMIYNEGVTKMFGYHKSEIDNVVNWWQQKIHADDLQAVVAALGEVSKNKAENLGLEYRFRCANGDYKYIYDRAFVMYDSNDNPSRIIGAMQDVTYEKQEEIRITKTTIAAQEVERRYIGEELHDNVNQILVGALISLGIAKDKVANSELFYNYMHITKDHITNAVKELRKLSHQLAPASFDDRTLDEIFSDLLLSINLDNTFTINFTHHNLHQQVISDDIQINLYRILQENFKNILKYAEATVIDVALTLSNNLVTLRVADNGKGFNARTAKKGIGLNNIKKRAEAFSGKFALNTSIGKGCEVIVEIPIA